MSAISQPQVLPGIPRSKTAKLTLLPLIAATYFMVAGGPYGLEDIVQMTGYGGALLILFLTPLLWSVPTALMVSELASAIPEEGGFYVWVRRGMGRFWGYQEVWLTLAGSIFEMALYPNLFVDYLGHFAPNMTSGHRGVWLGLGMIAICTLWNVWGARAVGNGATLMTILLLAPFAVLTVIGIAHRSAAGAAAGAVPRERVDVLGAVLIAMWNYMGWDNTSTVAGEVDRPQRTYPLAMLLSVLLVIATYVIPIAGVSHANIRPESWSTGGWVDVGRDVAGEWLAVAIAAGGVIGAIGTFNALMLSFSRLPVVMAQDGFLPRIFERRSERTGAPKIAIVVCAVCWAGCMFLGFERLVILDVLLTGLSILLEFWALVALRIREPELHRPYRVPGGVIGTVILGIPPAILMVLAGIRNHGERIGPVSGLAVGIGLVLLGPVLYLVSERVTRKPRPRI